MTETARQALTRHVSSNADGVTAVSVSFKRVDGGRLRLRYRVHGDAAKLAWPPLAPAVERQDDLWRDSCCEAFVGAASAESYREWNFSPAGHWQCYDFTARRTGRIAAAVAPPALDLGLAHTRGALTEWSLMAEVDIPAETVRLGLTVVVADRTGGIDYWALAHTAATPDFHDPHSWTAGV